MQSDLKGLAAYVSADIPGAAPRRDIVELPDGGSVELVGFFGDSFDVADVARTSTERRGGGSEERLVKYLWEHEHTSPFRHQHLRFHIRCPIFVARQWMKHVVGCAWNERSARYVEFSADSHGFWEPTEWRRGDERIKQGSAGPLSADEQLEADEVYGSAMRAAYDAYTRLISLGVCREQARAVLPVSTHTELVWTASLQALMHFLKLRLDAHAQAEMRMYAEACRDLTMAANKGAFKCALEVALG